MKTACVVVLMSALAAGQSVSNMMKQGEDVFTKTCGSSYCHGAKGGGAGAPRLVARGFDQAYITNTVTRGVPGTAMAAFGTSLPRPDLTAVIAYVSILNGVTPAPPAVPPSATASKTLSAAASRGRELFSDAVRGFERCSTCHEVNGIGMPVAAPITNIPRDTQALRGLATAAVKTAVLGNQSMPALSVSNGSRTVIFYDLTSAPPVLHTTEPTSVTWKAGSQWRHATVISAYNDAELTAILAYLREVL